MLMKLFEIQEIYEVADGVVRWFEYADLSIGWWFLNNRY